MKRLSLLVALSALSVAASATAAQAQAVISGPGATVTVATPVPLSGTVILEDNGRRDIPIGVNETGRLARFMAEDERQIRNEINLKNRDFEAWKPLESRSKNRMLRYTNGTLKVTHKAIQDRQSYIGRLPRYMGDERIMNNNIQFTNRDFEALKPEYAPNSKSVIDSRIRGLAADTNLVPGRRISVRRIDTTAAMPVLYFY